MLLSLQSFWHVAVLVLEKKNSSNLSFFFFLSDYSWPWQAMEVCTDKYFGSGLSGRAGDLETRVY